MNYVAEIEVKFAVGKLVILVTQYRDNVLEFTASFKSSEHDPEFSQPNIMVKGNKVAATAAFEKSFVLFETIWLHLV